MSLLDVMVILVALSVAGIAHAKEDDGKVTIRCEGGGERCHSGRKVHVLIDLETGMITVKNKGGVIHKQGVDSIEIEESKGFRKLLK